jgi:peptide chain release factor 3
LVFLARNSWHMNRNQEDFSNIRFLKTREQNRTVLQAAQ